MVDRQMLRTQSACVEVLLEVLRDAMHLKLHAITPQVMRMLEAATAIVGPC